VDAKLDYAKRPASEKLPHDIVTDYCIGLELDLHRSSFLIFRSHCCSCRSSFLQGLSEIIEIYNLRLA
jgi:hypothetical protein